MNCNSEENFFNFRRAAVGTGLDLSVPIRIFILLILLINLCACDAKYQRCSLLRVVDGDTLVADCDKVKTKLRLIGIDAPELAQEAWGARSKAFIESLIQTNHPLYLDFELEHKDKYGRTLSYVFFGDPKKPKFLNEEILSHGYAQIFLFPSSKKYAGRLKEAEFKARQEHLNIWGLETGLKQQPRAYRQKHHY